MLLLLILAALLMVVVATSAGLDSTFVPTPQDESLRLEASATKTATFNGTGFDNGLNFSPGGLGMRGVAVVLPSAVDRANGDETYTFVLQESADNNTFTDCGPAVAVVVSGTTASTSAFSVPGFISQRYVRVKCTIGGTTPSITYEAWLNFI